MRVRAHVSSRVLRLPYPGTDNKIHTRRAGVAVRRPDDATPEDCLHRADRAMYLAKQNGRNRVEFDV